MKIFSCCIIGILSCFLLSCNQDLEISKNTIVITGEFYNYSPKDSISNISIYVDDYVTKQVVNTQKEIDSFGQFRFEFDLTQQQDIWLLHENMIKLIVESGDSLHIKLDAKAKTDEEIFNGIEVTGNSAVTINERVLNFMANNPIDYDAYHQKRSELNPAGFYSYRDSIYKSESKYIDSLLANHSFSKPFINWLKAQKQFAFPNSFSFFELTYSDGKNDLEDNDSASRKVNTTKYDTSNIPELKPDYYINTLASTRIAKTTLDYTVISSQNELAGTSYDQKLDFYIQKLVQNYSNNPELVKLAINDLVKDQFNQERLSIYENNRSVIDLSLIHI